jgi:hypothetical protein
MIADTDWRLRPTASLINAALVRLLILYAGRSKCSVKAFDYQRPCIMGADFRRVLSTSLFLCGFLRRFCVFLLPSIARAPRNSLPLFGCTLSFARFDADLHVLVRAVLARASQESRR